MLFICFAMSDLFSRATSIMTTLLTLTMPKPKLLLAIPVRLRRYVSLFV